EDSMNARRRALIDLLEDAAEVDEDELDRFIDYAADDLSAPDLSFAPLLPDDDASLTDRVEALGDWAAGFVRGFDQSGGDLDDDAADALDDIQRIAEVSSEADDDEFDFFEVAEHLKVAVLLIHDATHGEERDDDELE